MRAVRLSTLEFVHCAPRRRERRPQWPNDAVCNCARDEGGPLGLGLQGQGPNRRQLLWSNDQGGEGVRKKWRTHDQPLAHAQALHLLAYPGPQQQGLGRTTPKLQDPKAITATARKLALLVCRVLRGDITYHDPGAAAYQQFNRTRTLRNLRQRAQQLDEVVALAVAFPDTAMVLNHFGGPILGGPNARRDDQVMAAWRAAMTRVAACENVYSKLGALPVRRSKAASGPASPLSSEEIAAGWRPFFDFAMDKFGARRCMFESNFPVQKRWCSYAVVWNACKRLAAGASTDEKAALFSGTAARTYRLPVALV